jgi:CBS domain containing-hemolysin-like protein
MVTATIPARSQAAAVPSAAQATARAAEHFLIAPPLFDAVCFTVGILFAFLVVPARIASGFAAGVACVSAFACQRVPRLAWPSVGPVYVLLGTFCSRLRQRSIRKKSCVLADNMPRMMEGK